MRGAFIAAVVALVPGLALADGFHTRDLGSGGSPDQCMARARAAVEGYARQAGTPNATINEGSWSVQGFDLAPGNVDVQVACPYRDNISSIVLLIAHSRGDNADRVAVVDGISAFWDGTNTGPSK